MTIMSPKISAVCDFRLDFDQFTIIGPADTIETDGGACQDTLTTTTVRIMFHKTLKNMFKHFFL